MYQRTTYNSWVNQWQCLCSAKNIKVKGLGHWARTKHKTVHISQSVHYTETWTEEKIISYSFSVTNRKHTIILPRQSLSANAAQLYVQGKRDLQSASLLANVTMGVCDARVVINYLQRATICTEAYSDSNPRLAVYILVNSWQIPAWQKHGELSAGKRRAIFAPRKRQDSGECRNVMFDSSLVTRLSPNHTTAHLREIYHTTFLPAMSAWLVTKPKFTCWLPHLHLQWDMAHDAAICYLVLMALGRRQLQRDFDLKRQTTISS